MRTLGIALMAVATFLVVFIGALHLHFPGDLAHDRMAWELEEASGGAWLVRAADARLYRGSGIALEDAVIYQRDLPSRRRAGAEAPPAVPVLRLEDVAVRARLLPLLRGERAAAFAIDLYGGELDGSFSMSETSQRLRLDGADIDLSRVPLEGEDWMVDATGKLAVSGDVTLGIEDVKESGGQLRIEVTDLVFQQATIMGMTLEPTPFSESVLAFDIDNGKAEVKEGRFASEPVDITVSGEIVLNKSLLRSRLKLELDVRFSDQFDRLAKMAPNLKAARDDDGVYHFKVTGTLKTPRFREERTKSRSRSVTPAVASPKIDDDDAGDDEAASSDDAEARRAERRDRIRDRRKRMLDRRKNQDSFDQPGIPPLPGPLGNLRDGEDLPTAIDQQRFIDGEDILDIELDDQDLPDDQDFDDDPQQDEEGLPGEDEVFDDEY